MYLSLKPPSNHAAGKAHCSRCKALCCRLTVVLQPEEKIPPHLTTHLANGLHVMARDAEGWCVAVDRQHMNCGIYETRPQVCRRFVMDGPYCRFVRAESAEPHEPTNASYPNHAAIVLQPTGSPSKGTSVMASVSGKTTNGFTYEGDYENANPDRVTWTASYRRSGVFFGMRHGRINGVLGIPAGEIDDTVKDDIESTWVRSS